MTKRKQNPAVPGASRSAESAKRVGFRPIGSLKPHPDARLLPEIEREAFQALLADLQRRGLQVPLEVTAAGVVLDGHLRLRAARALGWKTVSVRVVDPPDQREYMLLAALQRRQLSASQRAALAVELDQYRELREQGRRRQLANLNGQPAAEVAELPPRGKSRERAAALAGVSARTIQNAATVQAADPDLFEQIKQGQVAADKAARQVVQRERDSALATTPVPLPDGLFDLIYADPPWRLPGSPDSSRAVENHYPTMPLEQILALPVPAADDAVLFLWAVNSMLPEALQVLAAWGFDYQTHFVWIKDRFGLGHWNRTQHELLLIGRCGNHPAPTPARRLSSVIEAPRGRHSAKPEHVYQLLERMYPPAKRLELFKRGPTRAGWTAWGNQAEPEQ